MLHWWQASSSAKKYAFRNLRQGMELPARSLSMTSGSAISTADYRMGIEHPKEVWFADASVREMVVVSDRYDMTISLLVLETMGVMHEETPDEDMTTDLPRF
jgi:hypothetical protein